MTTITITDQLADDLQSEATKQGQTVERFLETIIRRERTLADRRKIEQEQEWWVSQPLSERAKYEGKFIAVHQQKIIDADANETQLTRRIRLKFGTTAVLIMPVEGVRDIWIHTPRLSFYDQAAL